MSKELIARLRHIYADGDPITEEAADCIEHLFGITEQLRQRVQELTAERDSAYKIADHYRDERDALKQKRDALVEAATMAVEMIEYDKHERRHVRWKLNDAIASVKEKA